MLTLLFNVLRESMSWKNFWIWNLSQQRMMEIVNWLLDSEMLSMNWMSKDKQLFPRISSWISSKISLNSLREKVMDLSNKMLMSVSRISTIVSRMLPNTKMMMEKMLISLVIFSILNSRLHFKTKISQKNNHPFLKNSIENCSVILIMKEIQSIISQMVSNQVWGGLWLKNQNSTNKIIFILKPKELLNSHLIWLFKWWDLSGRRISKEVLRLKFLDLSASIKFWMSMNSVLKIFKNL